MSSISRCTCRPKRTVFDGSRFCSMALMAPFGRRRETADDLCAARSLELTQGCHVRLGCHAQTDDSDAYRHSALLVATCEISSSVKAVRVGRHCLTASVAPVMLPLQINDKRAKRGNSHGREECRFHAIC
jgi:hypothetical protein